VGFRDKLSDSLSDFAVVYFIFANLTDTRLMKLKRLPLLCLFSLSFLGINAQDLGGLTTSLEQAIVPVQTASKTYEAKLKSLQPGILRYSYDEIDQKGNRTAYAYEFNLADIDPYAVREQTQKDAIYAVLAVRNKQKLIKVYKNEEVQAYDEQLSIITKDIESARAITDLVKKAIPLAEKTAASRLKLSGYDAMITWLNGNVKTVSLGTKNIAQTFTKGEKPGTVILKQVESDAKTSTEENYSFNLADINVNSINFKVAGNRFSLEMETLQKNRYIGLRKAGEDKPYVSSVSIHANNVDEARDIKTALTLAIPLAVEKVKADIPAVSTEKDGLQKIQSLTGDVVLGPKQITQAMEPQCFCSLTQTERDAKSTEVNVYKFNWMDVNPNASKIDVAGEKMYVELQVVDGKKMIMRTQNDKFSGYEKEIKLFMPGIENARRVKAVMEKVIEKCKASYKEPFGADASSAVTWLRNNVKDVTLDDVTYKQSLQEVEAGKPNKLKYTRTQVTSKGGAEEVYEFALSDVNPASVQVDVKGKWLYVTFESDFKGKIFKYYKDGKIQAYQSGIEFVVNDTEISRNMISALKKAIKLLKPNP
jgi:hypothetical protein